MNKYNKYTKFKYFWKSFNNILHIYVKKNNTFIKTLKWFLPCV